MYFYFLKHIIQYSASKKHVFAIENSFSFKKKIVFQGEKIYACKNHMGYLQEKILVVII